jgi:hypothetical protein
MIKQMCAFTLGLVTWCGAQMASATELMFKSNQAEVGKGTVQQIHMQPLTASTARLDILVGTFTGNGNYCTVSSMSNAHAMALIQAFNSGAMLGFWCRTTTPNAGSAIVDNLNYYITMGQ